ncbi:signal peptidase II Aspartic peptidase. MEROPS family A08 [Carnobacterium iners]|uniref:Lipoprotein signal peptidase n=1 Tax=Carnobacterium iners TaxID=1073423 RepID=A0A1X7NF51_9LACT|nr:signal peptidase II [Carnobacterium iners]SEK39247.1 signal peptidase II Aspartic peptidase. MEROPS family A08 [Carnobacterium iners]SMH36349.1 signal peptidase II Aspartic peptidase. MEROPS family A08 [Carnobacterium iners]
MFLYYILALLIIGIDQFTKYLTVANIDLYEVVEVFPSLLSWMYIQNTGAAWSILEGQMWFFYIVTAIVVVIVVYYLQKYGRQSRLLSLALSLVLAGAIGNVIDRIRLGYVVDMIRLEFIDFPIFNVADMALSVGVGLMILYVFLDEQDKKRQAN